MLHPVESARDGPPHTSRGPVSGYDSLAPCLAGTTFRQGDRAGALLVLQVAPDHHRLTSAQHSARSQRVPLS